MEATERREYRCGPTTAASPNRAKNLECSAGLPRLETRDCLARRCCRPAWEQGALDRTNKLSADDPAACLATDCRRCADRTESLWFELAAIPVRRASGLQRRRGLQTFCARDRLPSRKYGPALPDRSRSRCLS